MGETRDLIGIYGAIDRAADADPQLRAEVARLLPVYEDEDVQWFDEFEQWTTLLREDESADSPFPQSLQEALKGLAEEPEAEEALPTPRMLARRLFAIAVAARAFPELRDPDSELAETARAALQVKGLAPDDEKAQQLLELLADDDLIPSEEALTDPLDQWWADLLDTAAERDLIPAAASLGPRPCSGKLVMVGGVPVATLTAGFETDQVTVAQAKTFLNPVNWPSCSDFWCTMEKTGVTASGAHQYREVVSTDCDNPGAAWTIQADLDFFFVDEGPPAFAAAEYTLSHEPQANDAVLVDAGSLVLEEIGTAGAPRLKATTTKRILFNHPFSGEQLSLIMCALGYASIVEDLVFSCAALKKKGKAFPPKVSKKDKEAAGAGAAPPAPVEPPIKVLADDAAAAFKSCVDECADAVQSSSDKARMGEYTADALVQDMAKMWVRMLRDTATGLELGVRSAQTAADARRRSGS